MDLSAARLFNSYAAHPVALQPQLSIMPSGHVKRFSGTIAQLVGPTPHGMSCSSMPSDERIVTAPAPFVTRKVQKR